MPTARQAGLLWGAAARVSPGPVVASLGAKVRSELKEPQIRLSGWGPPVPALGSEVSGERGPHPYQPLELPVMLVPALWPERRPGHSRNEPRCPTHPRVAVLCP